MTDYSTWYQQLDKPFFSPPEWAFGLAWGIIYPLIALAFIALLVSVFKKKTPSWLIWVFVLNMVFNIVFTPIQFGLRSNILAAIDIILVLITLVTFEWYAFKTSKTSFYLMVPYLLWGSFATILQLTITFMNL